MQRGAHLTRERLAFSLSLFMETVHRANLADFLANRGLEIFDLHRQ